MRQAVALSKREINVRNKKLDDDEFRGERKKALSSWLTGGEIDLDEAIAYHKSLPGHKNFTRRAQRAKKDGEVLMQPRGGLCLVDEYIEKLKAFEDNGKADIVFLQSNSYSRNERYDLVEKAISDSKKAGRSLLNGTCVENWGLKETRRLCESVGIPVEGGGSTFLCHDLSLAAGVTSILLMALSQLIYFPNEPPEGMIKRNQIHSRLVGYYEEHGVPINVRPIPFNSVSYPSNSLEAAQTIIDSLLLAEQGVKHIGLGVRQNFHLVQEVAKGMALSELSEEYFNRLGYGDVEQFLSYYAWQPAWPRDEAQCSGMIALGAAGAHFSGACRLLIKSLDEGVGLPTTEGQVFVLRETKQMLNLLRGQKFPLSQEVEDEKKMIADEARLIIEKVLDLGDGDLVVGSVIAFDAGVLDNPFSSNIYTKSRVVSTRDAAGASRYLDCGNLPFTREIVEYHRERVEQRKKIEKVEKDYALLLRDLAGFGGSL